MLRIANSLAPLDRPSRQAQIWKTGKQGVAEAKAGVYNIVLDFCGLLFTERYTLVLMHMLHWLSCQYNRLRTFAKANAASLARSLALPSDSPCNALSNTKYLRFF
jgi:hypothetical protein